MNSINRYSGKTIPSEIFELLLEADPSEEKIKTYLQTGELYVAEEDGQLLGAYVLIFDLKKSKAELINISIAKPFQNQGYGQILVKNAIERCAERRIKELELGTGNSSIGQLYFYQKCGFEMSHILPNYFVENYTDPILENGLQCKHMVRFKMVISS